MQSKKGYSKEMLEVIANDFAGWDRKIDAKMSSALLKSHPLTRKLHGLLSFPNQYMVQKVDDIVRSFIKD